MWRSAGKLLLIWGLIIVSAQREDGDEEPETNVDDEDQPDGDDEDQPERDGDEEDQPDEDDEDQPDGDGDDNTQPDEDGDEEDQPDGDGDEEDQPDEDDEDQADGDGDDNTQPDEEDKDEPKKKYTLDVLKRKDKPMGTFAEEDFSEYNDKNYKIKSGKKSKSGGNFRSGGGSRGSKVPVQKKVKPLPHEPHKDDPKGCGNPICVVIDRRVVRFPSICQYSKFACDNSRKNQVNFIQKGDCYDIIDSEEGATEKAWTPEDLDLGDCSECMADPNCGVPVTVNIDLQNILLGKSSAFGGPTFHEQNAEQGRMVGVPIEFDCVCSLMKWLKKRKTTNINTQVIGVAIGNKKDIYPIDEHSSKCLWTEWFDHETPCLGNGDREVYSEHHSRLEQSYTGPLRICLPQECADKTQHEGGSEITQVSAIDATEGNAMGFDGKPFKQVLSKMTTLEIQCLDDEQNITSLPPPFKFSEGIEGKKSGKSTCLDYKMRYCCKSTLMYRPQLLSYFQQYIVQPLPIGPSRSNITIGEDGRLSKVVVTVFPTQGQPDGSSSEITITPIDKTDKKNKRVEVVITHPDGSQTTSVQGKYKTRQTPDGAMEIIIELEKQTGGKYGKLIIKSGSGGEVIVTEIHTPTGVKAVSEVTTASQCKCIKPVFLGTAEDPDEPKPDKVIKTIMTDDKGQKMTIVSELNGNKISSEGEVTLPDGGNGIWDYLATITQELNIEYFIESPPLATIFAECEWMDWLNQKSPDSKTGDELELKHYTMTKRHLRGHICGNDPEASHYIDAVTAEDQTPWHELTVGSRQYEVYKLSPFHGYICKDQNMPDTEKGYCKDMKVRYCCSKQRRAQWSEWKEWSTCTKDCGGGLKTRKKTCEQLSMRMRKSKKDQALYNPTCVGENDNLKRKLIAEQTVSCNIEGCPVNFTWGSWSFWSSCSVTCSSGTKTRSRTCAPAENGGAPCPDKREEKDEYYEERECTKSDCETYFEGEWCAWSSCSATCGEGVQARLRKCYSNTTLQEVQNQNCANEHSHFNQDKKCKLKECPIDGKWTLWNEWSSCTQNCVPHPDSGGENTKARRTRKRHCNNPPAAFKGKKCKKDPKFTWLSHEKAEEDSTACITELTRKDEPDNLVTKWCPEPCILTEWGEWSDCSKTCIVSKNGERVGYQGKYCREHSDEFYRWADSLNPLDVPVAPDQMPVRERIRTIYKEARFGGECFEKKKGFDDGVLTHTEPCVICTEHTYDQDEKRNTNVVDWPKLTYPHPDNEKCVGYCPVDCQWEEGFLFTDSKKSIEKYYEENKNQFDDPDDQRQGTHCWYSRVIAYFERTKKKDLAENFFKELQDEIIPKILNHENIDIGERPHYTKSEDVKAFQPLWKKYKKNRKDRRTRSMIKAIGYTDSPGLYNTDMKELIRLMESEIRKYAVVPVLDGLYGGKACQREYYDKKYLTVRKEDDPKYDEETMSSVEPYDYKLTYKDCKIVICPPRVILDAEPEPVLPRCEHYSWAAWGEWGKCTKRCGQDATRERKRKCVNLCNQKEAAGKCEPYENKMLNKKFTDTDETSCTPCPTPEQSFWTQWSDWIIMKGAGCGSGTREKSRTRKCVQGKDKSSKCDGDNEQIMKIPMPSCPGGGTPDEPDETDGDDGSPEGGAGGDEEENPDTQDEDDNNPDENEEEDDGGDDEGDDGGDDGGPDNEGGSGDLDDVEEPND